LTSTKIVVESLVESKIDCLKEEKDLYLYYFLVRYPGRTIIFVNSISCIKRLVPILQLLRVPVWGIHANMQQKQRLKNIERFKSQENSAIVSTDVLARGMDIHDVDHVIHYQVPRTTEIYVHRSGRTARANNEGLSVILVDPSERVQFKNIVNILNKGKENDSLLDFPVDHRYIPSVRKRVKLAINLDKEIHQKQKKTYEKNWYIKKAQDLDIELDDDLIKENEDEDFENKRHNQRVESLKNNLKQMLDTPILPEGASRSYITRERITPLASHKGNALHDVRNN
jgi:ATP-dependent RNA helicase DDX24/MAK5